MIGMISQPPAVVGYFVFKNGYNTIRYAMYRKPKFITRWAMKFIFELEWKDGTF